MDSTPAGIKAWLLAYREREAEIEMQMERLERYMTRHETAGAQELTGMPGSHRPPSDIMAEYVARKEELENEIRSAISAQNETGREIESILQNMNSASEKSLIRMRYMDRCSWSEVSSMLFGSKPDFEDRRDSYLRRVHRIHKSALSHMARSAAGLQKQ